jgi:hypothetical protein
MSRALRETGLSRLSRDLGESSAISTRRLLLLRLTYTRIYARWMNWQMRQSLSTRTNSLPRKRPAETLSLRSRHSKRARTTVAIRSRLSNARSRMPKIEKPTLVTNSELSSLRSRWGQSNSKIWRVIWKTESLLEPILSRTRLRG